MKRIAYYFVFLCCIILLSSNAFAKIKIAVLPFDSGEINKWHMSEEQMVSGITDTLINQLVELEDIEIVERSRLTGIIEEQNFGHSARADVMTVAQIGRLAGANVVLMGTIHTLDISETGGIQISFIQAKGTTAKTELSVRAVDVETGVILGTAHGVGSSSGASLAVLNFHGVSFFSDNFQNSTIGKSVKEAIDELTTQLAEQYRDWFTPRIELTGNIVAVVSDKYVVNLGSKHGIDKGDRFDVYELVRVTGIAKPVEIPLGTIRVISVDPEASVAESENGTYEEGAFVRR